MVQLGRQLSVIASGRSRGHGLAVIHTHRALKYEENGDLDRAFADHNESIRLDPNDPFAYNGAPRLSTLRPLQVWQSRPVFISSTFADMQAEREYLRTRVFPELEERLRARRHNLEWVDLRVGVATASQDDEHVRELHVLKVCLDEVRRCRPLYSRRHLVMSSPMHRSSHL